MSNKTRKRIWPVSLAAAIGVVAMLAVLAATVWTPGPAQAQSGTPVALPPDSLAAMATSATEISLSWNPGLGHASYELQRKSGSADFATVSSTIAGNSRSYSDTGLTAETTYTYRVRGVNGDYSSPWATEAMATTDALEPPPSPTPTATPEPDAFSNSSTSGGAGVEMKLTIGSLPMDAVDGSSVELFLEDDFQVPDSIDRGAVYFTVPGGGDDQNNGGRVYAQYAVEIDDDEHFTANKKDYAIRVFIPDMNDADDSGYDGPEMGQMVNLVFTKAAGIKNPTEAGTHSVGYKVLGPDAEPNKTAGIVQLGTVATNAKISLSDEDAGRGKEITITGSGFNDGTGAEARVWVGTEADKDRVKDPAFCRQIMQNGEKLGAAPVGSDDKFTITFTVHQDEFDAGAVNYICAADSEAGDPRGASEVKVFKLEASVSASPASASFGDEVTIKPRDFGFAISKITFGPSHVWMASEANTGMTGCATAYVAGDERSDGSTIVCMKEKDGSDYVFELPGGLDEQIQIAVTDKHPTDETLTPGHQTKRIYMGVVASGLTLSKSEVAPNESIVISGNGFNRGVKIMVSKITIDGEVLDVDDAGTEGVRANRYVTTTSNGTFTVTARVWAMGSTNPALDDDTYTVKVVDEQGFEGEADITVKEPSIMVSPDTASPRDFIIISGENWPVTTADLDNEVAITIHKGETYQRTRSASVDGNGRFRYEYQLPAGVRIGDDQKVQVRFDGDGGDIEEDATFAVTEAELGVMPAAAAPGQTISVNIEGMPPYTLVAHVKIDGANRIGGRNVNTDRDGNATVGDILVPFLDPGFYPVEVKVGDETRVAQLEVLSEAIVPGVAATLPGAVSDLGDNLEAIFHFNNTNKEWTFFDPRPEFADLNTLTELNGGQPYWVLVGESQDDVDWNGRLDSFTCAAGDCWNLKIW